MLSAPYFETMHRLHEVKHFDELASILVEKMPEILGTGEAVIMEIDSAKMLRSVFGQGEFSQRLQRRIGVMDHLCEQHPASGLMDITRLGYSAVAVSDVVELEIYQSCEWVKQVFGDLQPTDCLIGQMVSGGYRHGILGVYLQGGTFQDLVLRERFNAVLLGVRGILERIDGRDAEDKFFHKVLTSQTRQGLPIFIMNKRSEVIPLSHAAVSFSESRWDRDEPMWTLNESARSAVEAVALEAWENPVEPRWGSIELNLGRGTEPMELLPKINGEAIIIITPDQSAEAEKAEILTDRQREIMGWIAEGKTSAEAGIILGISPRTVEKHLEAIFQRMGVENRIAAVRSFLEMAGRSNAGH